MNWYAYSPQPLLCMRNNDQNTSSLRLQMIPMLRKEIKFIYDRVLVCFDGRLRSTICGQIRVPI